MTNTVRQRDVGWMDNPSSEAEVLEILAGTLNGDWLLPGVPLGSTLVLPARQPYGISESCVLRDGVDWNLIGFEWGLS